MKEKNKKVVWIKRGLEPYDGQSVMYGS